MTLPDGDQIPGEWHQWRGTIDTKLHNIDQKVDKNSDTLEKMPDVIERRLKKVVDNSQSRMPAVRTNPTTEGQPITFKYAFDKLWPVFVALGMLLLGYVLRGQF